MAGFNARGHSSTLIHIAINITSYDLSLEWDNLVDYIIDNYRIILSVFIAEDVLSIILFSLCNSGDDFHPIVFKGLSFLVNKGLKICIIKTIKYSSDYRQYSDLNVAINMS
jgi:hypothetical protein